LNCFAAEEFEKIDDDALQGHSVIKKDTRDFTTSIAASMPIAAHMSIAASVPIAVHTTSIAAHMKRTILVIIDSTLHATT
jgi:hypothetical protein